MAKRKKKHWSYNAGERGQDWVRAYQDGRDGRFYYEWMETVVEVDPETGEERRVRKRRRALLKDVTTKSEAKRRADEARDRFAEMDNEEEPADVRPPLTVARLFRLYLKEVTPGKGKSKRDHDGRAIRVWTAFFDAQPEPARHSSRHPSTLDRVDWDRFIAWRREGRIPDWPRPARDRQLEYDLTFMVGVLNWAVGAGEEGKTYLERSPWATEIRKAQKWERPRELNPHRPAMTNELRERLIAHESNWQFGAALRVGRSTVSRNSSVRHLWWSDLDLDAATVRWRGEYDKAGREVVVPLEADAVAALRAAPRRGIGDTWVFASEMNPEEPTSRHTFQTWLRRAKQRLLKSIEDPRERARMKEQLRGLGYHGEKRAGVRDPEFRELAPAYQEKIARTNYSTLKSVYDEITVDDIRDARRQARFRAGHHEQLTADN